MNGYDSHLDHALERHEHEMDQCPPRTTRPSVDQMARSLMDDYRWPLTYTSGRVMVGVDLDYWYAVEARIIELKEETYDKHT